MHRDSIRRYYQEKLKTGSEHYQILGWEGYAQQHARFEALCREVDLQGKSLLDVGCGLGDLYDHLQRRGIRADYLGVDILDFMIEKARQDNPGGSFLCTDIFKEDKLPRSSFDVVYASGIFNLDLGNNQEFFRAALQRFYGLSSEAVVFSLLHERSTQQEAPYFYYRPSQVVDCIDRMGLRVKRIDILEDYAENDFTVVIRTAVSV